MNPTLLMLVLAAAPVPSLEPAAEAPAAAENAEAAEVEMEDADEGESAQLSPEIIAKLSPEQLTSVLVARETAQNAGTSWTSIEWMSVFGFFFTVFAVVAGVLGFSLTRYLARERTLRAAIQSGNTPAALFAPLSKDRADLRRGVLFVASGLGIGVVALVATGNPMNAVVALLPLTIGGGYLVSWKLLSPSSPAGRGMEQQQA